MAALRGDGDGLILAPGECHKECNTVVACWNFGCGNLLLKFYLHVV